MTDETKPRQLGIVPLTSEAVNFIYFDGVVAYGVNFGTIQLELGAVALSAVDNTSTKPNAVTVARLRCSPHGAVHLKAAIEKSLELLSSNIRAAGKVATLN